MKRNPMSLKAIINNIAKENKVSAQSVLQTYMLERLLERISISKYKDNFILKGGMLISAMLGTDSRTTMDMDTTIKGFKLTEENITNIINEICNIKIDDGVTFEVKKIELIREDDDYGGYRITFKANYMESMPVIMKIDITTGDKITYKEIKYSFNLMLEDRRIQIWSYNLETVIAEYIQELIGADLFKVEPSKPYSKNYKECCDEALEEKRQNARPELKKYLNDISNYNTIYIGSPIYWGTMPISMFTQ